MPFAQFVGYNLGYMPSGDVEAQRRCYNYLAATVTKLAKRVGTAAELENDKTQYKFLKDLKDMVETAHGSYRWQRASNFWRYWDKSKDQIIHVHDDTTDKEDVLTRIGELEDGRYYHD